MDVGPKIFKDPSLLEPYHGAPLLIYPYTQVCVISSNRTEIGDTIPPTKTSPPLDIPPVEEILPQKLPENPTTLPIPNFTLS
jgi:hypothetical protein